MKKKYLIGGLGLLLFAGALYAFQQPPLVTITPATPSTVYVNSTTTVTITAQITDPRVILTGVNLLQVDPMTGAQTIAGSLTSQGGGKFSIRIQPKSTAAQLFAYEVSAAFQGLLKRSISLPITVAVAPLGVVLPPDPGPAGMQTLAGTDSDGDGVRDDVERWIAVTAPNSTKTRMGLAQEAKAIQEVILSTAPSQAVAASNAELDSLVCLAGIIQTNAASAMSDELKSIILNTTPRINAYLTSNSQTSGSAYGLPSIANRTSLCTFNPAGLPN